MVIVDTADEWNADLILVRSHGYKDISRWMLGSAAREVLRHGSCSVEIVRASRDPAKVASGAMKIGGSDSQSLCFVSAAQKVKMKR